MNSLSFFLVFTTTDSHQCTYILIPKKKVSNKFRAHRDFFSYKLTMLIRPPHVGQINQYQLKVKLLERK